MSRIALLVSGKGTLLRPILEAGIAVEVVIADRECPALVIAREHDVPAQLIQRDDFTSAFNRDEYTSRLVAALKQYQPMLVFMAGFKTILGEEAFETFPAKIINIHPSLLPAFPGKNAIRDTIAYGAKISGFTIHFATATVDCGPVLLQQHTYVSSSDTEESLRARINAMQQKLYPIFIKGLVG